MARFWSRKRLTDLLFRARIDFTHKGLKSLTESEWDLLGDYAFHKVSPREKDHQPQRDVSKILDQINTSELKHLRKC